MLCPAPFFHRYIASNSKASLCCAAPKIGDNDFSDWNGKDYQNIRKQMLNDDELPPICRECPAVEASGGDSLRTQMVKVYNSLGNPKPDIVTGTVFDAPISYDLRMNNICNLSCRMCGPLSSTQIVKEGLKHPEIWQEGDLNEFKYDPSEIISNAGAIFELKLLGGEPTLQPEARAILEELVKIKNTAINLHITTNATNVNRKFYDLVEKFDDTHISISIDGWGKQHDYIRGPASNFNTIWKNVDKIRNLKNKPDITIQQTVSIFNIFDFWKLGKKYHDALHVGFVEYPKHYSPIIMPRKWKEKAIEIAKANNSYNKYVHIFNLLMSEEGNEKLMVRAKHLSELKDHARGQYLIDHYPIVHEMFEEIE